MLFLWNNQICIHAHHVKVQLQLRNSRRRSITYGEDSETRQTPKLALAPFPRGRGGVLAALKWRAFHWHDKLQLPSFPAKICSYCAIGFAKYSIAGH